MAVRGCDEHPATEARDDGRVDTWQESRYRVFRKVTENAYAAMLHFYSPTFPEIAIKSFFVRTRHSSRVAFFYPARLGPESKCSLVSSITWK